MKINPMRACGLTVTAGLISVWAAGPAHSERGCTFPHGDATSVGEMIAAIKNEKAMCALPWRALKRVTAKPEARDRLQAAYREVAAKYPERANAAAARSTDVEAAAGNPKPMLALADANVVAHPEDKTLANMSCFARAAYGFDIENAMPYCDAAVANGRPGYALVNRGTAELQLGRFQEAFQDFDEALRTRKQLQNRWLIRAVYGRGVARLRLGDKRGREDVDIAIKTYPEVSADFADFGIKP